MTTTELTEIFDGVISLIAKNREAVNPQLLSQVDSMLTTIKQPHTHAAICALFGMTPSELDNIFSAVEKGIAAERDILTRGTDTKIVHLLEQLKKRPAILYTISLFI